MGTDQSGHWYRNVLNCIQMLGDQDGVGGMTAVFPGHSRKYLSCFCVPKASRLFKPKVRLNRSRSVIVLFTTLDGLILTI